MTALASSINKAGRLKIGYEVSDLRRHSFQILRPRARSGNVHFHIHPVGAVIRVADLLMCTERY